MSKQWGCALRRRFEWIAPVFLVALLVQFFAPVAAGFAMAAANDPLSGAPICAHDTGVPQAPADHSHHPSDCCIFCTQAHATFTPSASPQVLSAVAKRVDMRAPLWVYAAPRARPVRTAKARAPPCFS